MILRFSLVAAVASVSAFQPTFAAPIPITIPGHVTWCTDSNPVASTFFDNDTFGKALFDALYEKIEKEAIQTNLPSLGIPFLEEVRVVPGPKITAGTTERSPVSYSVVTVCLVTPPSAPAFAKGRRLDVPEKMAVAELCEPSRVEDCEAEIKAAITNGAAGNVDPSKIRWRTRQAVSSETTADAIAGAFIDYKLHPLIEGAEPPPCPDNLIAVAAELP